MTTVEDILARDYEISISDAFNRGWDTVKSAFWLCVGATFLVYVVLFVSAAVPFIGGLIQLVIQGALMGGLYVFYIKQIRGQEATINDAFSGFGPRFVQLMLTSIVMSIPSRLCVAKHSRLVCSIRKADGCGWHHSAIHQDHVWVER